MSYYDPFDGRYDLTAPSTGGGGVATPSTLMRPASEAQREADVEAPAPAVEVSVYTNTQLKGMQKDELQELARQRGLPTGGTRAELIERIESAQGATA